MRSLFAALSILIATEAYALSKGSFDGATFRGEGFTATYKLLKDNEGAPKSLYKIPVKGESQRWYIDIKVAEGAKLDVIHIPAGYKLGPGMVGTVYYEFKDGQRDGGLVIAEKDGLVVVAGGKVFVGSYPIQSLTKITPENEYEATKFVEIPVGGKVLKYMVQNDGGEARINPVKKLYN